MLDRGHRRVLDHLVNIFSHMNVQSVVAGLQLQVCNSVVESYIDSQIDS